MSKCTIDDVDFKDITDEDIEPIVDIPATKEEFDNRFSLVNDEYPIANIQFNDICDDDLDLIVQAPSLHKDFINRFRI